MSIAADDMSSRPLAKVPADEVTAVVLTYLRPRLAGDVVRGLIDRDHLDPRRIVVVVNGEGGLDDARLEDAVRMVRLPHNCGPAGGFKIGLLEAFRDPLVRWAYLCEDDVGLFDLPSPRLAELLDRVTAGTRARGPGPERREVGAVVAYGRVFVGRGAHTVNVVPVAPADGLSPVDVACWGATLVSRAVVDAGVLPDSTWFFGLEDFDFFCRVRDAGFDVLLDEVAARQVAEQQTNAGRESAIRDRRPTDMAEAWRALLPRPQLVRSGPSARPSELDGLAPRLLGSALAESPVERRAQGHRPRAVGRGPWTPGGEPSLPARGR